MKTFVFLSCIVAAAAQSSPFFQNLIDHALPSGNALVQGALKGAGLCPKESLVNGGADGCAGGLAELSATERIQRNSITNALYRKLQARTNADKVGLMANNVMNEGQEFIADTFKSVVDTIKDKVIDPVGNWTVDTFTGKNTCGQYSYTVGNLQGLCTASIQSAKITAETAESMTIEVHGSVPSVSVSVGGSASGKVAGVPSPSVGLDGTGTVKNIQVVATATATMTSNIDSLAITDFDSIKKAFCVSVVVNSVSMGDIDVNINNLGALNGMLNMIVDAVKGTFVPSVESLIKEKGTDAVNDMLKGMFGDGKC